MLSADRAPVLDSKKEGLVCNSLWLGLCSMVEFLSSDIPKSVPAAFGEEAVPV